MKLCAYTICKNESEHVDIWVQALKDEVDYICVLDTGSTDDTIEKFKQYPFVIIEQKKISPWRFDAARNESMKLIPDDTDVAMVVDLDETYRPGFRYHIENAFNNGYNLISGYKVTFENGQQISREGDELSLPILADIKNWHWEYPVHEYPAYYDEDKVKEVLVPEIVCEHRPNLTKGREQYIDILKRWYESSDTPEAICVEKYTVELYQRGFKEESYKVLSESIDKCRNTNDYTGRTTLYRNAYNMVILAREHGDYDIIPKYIEMTKSSGVKTRSFFMYEARYEAEVNNNYERAANAAMEALLVENIDPRPYIEDSSLFNTGQVEASLAFYLFKLKKYDEAFEFAKRALDFQPFNEEYINSYELYRRYHENKICVYTTCYNESKFIEKWLDNNKDADHIVVLIHDCKDDSEEKFRKAQENQKISIGYGFYKDWRFDKGKNDAMHLAYALAPECNIFVFTSLDEYWDPGWADEVKSNWIPGETQQCWYNFVQSHDEFGNDTGTSYFNWMISKDPKWHWEYPIHEAILYGDNEPIKGINLFDKVKLQHWPDKKKPRDYLALHKLRWEEYKNDISYLYLIREHVLWSKYKEAYDLAKKFDHEHTDLVPEENAFIYLMQGICCEHFENFDEALDCYKKAHEIYNNFRTPLVRSAVIYAEVGAYAKSEEMFNKALDETVNLYSWLNDPWDWRSKPFYWLSLVKLKINKEEEALGYALFASQIDTTDDFKKHYQEILDKCDGK